MKTPRTWEEYDHWKAQQMLGDLVTMAVTTALLTAFAFWVMSCQGTAYAATADEFCDAVYWTEGGPKTRHPYGVLSVSCHDPASCRQICLNSYNNNQKRFLAQSKYKQFDELFASRWAPLNAENDPTGLNQHWLKNLRWFLAHPKG